MRKIGRDAYLKLLRSKAFNASEQYIFDIIENSKRWKKLVALMLSNTLNLLEDFGEKR